MNPHIFLLQETVRLLTSEIIDNIVFIGGATVSLHFDQASTLDVRSTRDVDFLVDVLSPVQYQKTCSKIRACGFRQSVAPSQDGDDLICRYMSPDGKLIIDVLPVDTTMLGWQASQWFADTIREAERYVLPNGTGILIATPVNLVATKLEAFMGRGKDDLLASKDAADIVNLLAGRNALVMEILSAPEVKRLYIQQGLAAMQADRDFIYLLQSELNLLPAKQVSDVERQITDFCAMQL